MGVCRNGVGFEGKDGCLGGSGLGRAGVGLLKVGLGRGGAALGEIVLFGDVGVNLPAFFTNDGLRVLEGGLSCFDWFIICRRPL